MNNECRIKEAVQPVEDTDDDDEDTFMSAVGLGVAVAGLFSEPDDDTFTGGGGDFGGGGASDDF